MWVNRTFSLCLLTTDTAFNESPPILKPNVFRNYVRRFLERSSRIIVQDHGVGANVKSMYQDNSDL